MPLLPHGETGAPVGVDVVSNWWDHFCLCADPVPRMAAASATGLVGRDIHHFRVRGRPGRVDAARRPKGNRALPQETAAAHRRRNRDREYGGIAAQARRGAVRAGRAAARHRARRRLAAQEATAARLAGAATRYRLRMAPCLARQGAHRPRNRAPDSRRARRNAHRSAAGRHRQDQQAPHIPAPDPDQPGAGIRPRHRGPRAGAAGPRFSAISMPTTCSPIR